MFFLSPSFLFPSFWGYQVILSRCWLAKKGPTWRLTPSETGYTLDTGVQMRGTPIHPYMHVHKRTRRAVHTCKPRTYQLSFGQLSVFCSHPMCSILLLHHHQNKPVHNHRTENRQPRVQIERPLNAMTSPEEHTSQQKQRASGYRIEKSLRDCFVLRPPLNKKCFK